MAQGTRALPLGVQILSISCSFWENLAKSYVGTPPGVLVPSPRGNPPLNCIMIFQKINITISGLLLSHLRNWSCWWYYNIVSYKHTFIKLDSNDTKLKVQNLLRNVLASFSQWPWNFTQNILNTLFPNTYFETHKRSRPSLDHTLDRLPPGTHCASEVQVFTCGYQCVFICGRAAALDQPD